MYTGITVNGFRVDTTDHFDDQMRERNIQLSDIIKAIKEHPEVFKYNDTGQELCYRSDDVSFMFEVRFGKVVLITGMSWFAEYVRDAIII
ncbi:MAG: hypothetical protein ACOC2U_03095 [bacterium]